METFILKLRSNSKADLYFRTHETSTLLGHLTFTSHQLDRFIELVGKGEKGCATKFEIGHIHEAFYLNKEDK